MGSVEKTPERIAVLKKLHPNRAMFYEHFNTGMKKFTYHLDTHMPKSTLTNLNLYVNNLSKEPRWDINVYVAQDKPHGAHRIGVHRHRRLVRITGFSASVFGPDQQ